MFGFDFDQEFSKLLIRSKLKVFRRHLPEVMRTLLPAMTAPVRHGVLKLLRIRVSALRLCAKAPSNTPGNGLKLAIFLVMHSGMQPDAINRRVGGVPGNLRFAPRPSEEGQSATLPQTSLNTSNWIVDPPDSLVAAQNFHFAISASFRMNQSMGNDFLFDEVR